MNNSPEKRQAVCCITLTRILPYVILILYHNSVNACVLYGTLVHSGILVSYRFPERKYGNVD